MGPHGEQDGDPKGGTAREFLDRPRGRRPQLEWWRVECGVVEWWSGGVVEWWSGGDHDTENGSLRMAAASVLCYHYLLD